MKILTVVGNRPQFIKAAAVSSALRDSHDEILVHTGQHYDHEMSAIFFDELRLPRPNYELGVGSGSHASQTAAILAGLEPVAIAERPDLLLVYGDTNSTLAGALIGAKLRIPVVHVEAGMRSFDRDMPEEVNRVIADHCSDLLLCSSERAVENLRNEGIEHNVYLVGDVMLDVARQFAERAEQESDVLERFGLSSGEYVLATAHRPGNVDDPGRLKQLIDLLAAVSDRVVFPIHARTQRRLEVTGLQQEVAAISSLLALPAVGYLDFIKLLRHAKALLTDSGGVQKEAYLFSIPCITLRDSTEWVETVDSGWNTLVDLDIKKAQTALATQLPSEHPELYGDGQATARLLEAVSAFARASTLRNVQREVR